MNNLEKFGVVELKQEELREIEGGGIFVALILAATAWAVANFVKDVIINGENYDPTSW